MNVLALCADPGIPLDSAKGATVHVLALWRALARQGARVHGIAPWRGGPWAEPRTASLTVHAVPARNADQATLLDRLRGQAILAAEASAPDFVWERLSLGSDLGRCMAESLRVPLAIEINAPLDEEAERYRGAKLTPETRAAQRRLLDAATIVYCVSEALIPYALARGAPRDRVRVLPNGVDTDAFGARPPLFAGRTRVAFVGSFKAWHGVEVLLEALQRAVAEGADLECDLVGDGPTRHQLEALVSQAGLEHRVRFLGARPHEEIPDLLREAEIAVAPAPGDVDYYFSPLKVYEYAAAGCAIVAPRAGQVAERFHHREDALLVSPGSPAELAEALCELARDGTLRARLGARARARARAEFDWSQVAATLMDWMGATEAEAAS